MEFQAEFSGRLEALEKRFEGMMDKQGNHRKLMTVKSPTAIRVKVQLAFKLYPSDVIITSLTHSEVHTYLCFM